MTSIIDPNQNYQLFTIEKNWGCIEITTGENIPGSPALQNEAKDFLQRLSTADFRFLKPGAVTTGTFLQPTGKIIFFFKALFSPDSNPSYHRYLLFIPTSESFSIDHALEHLERFHFRENIKIQKTDHYAYLRLIHSAAGLNLEHLQSEFGLTLFEEKRLKLNAQIQDLGMFIATEKVDSLALKLKSLNFQHVPNLNFFHLICAEPQHPNEINSNYTPLDINLDYAVSENKGCFPGQEVIERMRSMGKAAKKILRFTFKATDQTIENLQISQFKLAAIESDGKKILGTVSNFAQNINKTEQWIGLAIVSRVSIEQLEPNTKFEIVSSVPEPQKTSEKIEKTNVHENYIVEILP